MLTDEERTELHRQLEAIQREEDRRIRRSEEARVFALGARTRPIEPRRPFGPPPRMR